MMLCGKCGGKLIVKDSTLSRFIDYVLVSRKRQCVDCGMIYESSERVYGATINSGYKHGNEGR